LSQYIQAVNATQTAAVAVIARAGTVASIARAGTFASLAAAVLGFVAIAAPAVCPTAAATALATVNSIQEHQVPRRTDATELAYDGRHCGVGGSHALLGGNDPLANFCMNQ
jgi:hypothetical protein